MATTKAATRATNADWFRMCQAASPQFKSTTAKITAERLNKGYEANKDFTADPMRINDFLSISMRIVFQKIDIARARNPLEDYGIAEHYNTPLGDTVQRMAIQAIDPVSPAFRNLQNGQWVNDQIVRKPAMTERFFSQNFDFQNFITIQDYQVKLIFASEYGMSDVIGGILAQLENSYKKQRYLNSLAALNAGLNSTDHPLKSTQEITIEGFAAAGAKPTDQNLLDMIEAIKNVSSNMTLEPSSSAYNAASFETAVDNSEYIIVMRPDILNAIQLRLRVGAYNPDDLSLPFPVKPMLNFGGLVPTSDGTTEVFPVYDELGAVKGFNAAADQSEVTIEKSAVQYKDPNIQRIGLIVQKGILFTTEQNPLTVRPAPFNSRGEYQNYFCNQVGAGVHYDYNYNIVSINRPA